MYTCRLRPLTLPAFFLFPMLAPCRPPAPPATAPRSRLLSFLEHRLGPERTRALCRLLRTGEVMLTGSAVLCAITGQGRPRDLNFIALPNFPAAALITALDAYENVTCACVLPLGTHPTTNRVARRSSRYRDRADLVVVPWFIRTSSGLRAHLVSSADAAPCGFDGREVWARLEPPLHDDRLATPLNYPKQSSTDTCAVLSAHRAAWRRQRLAQAGIRLECRDHSPHNAVADGFVCALCFELFLDPLGLPPGLGRLIFQFAHEHDLACAEPCCATEDPAVLEPPKPRRRRYCFNYARQS